MNLRRVLVGVICLKLPVTPYHPKEVLGMWWSANEAVEQKIAKIYLCDQCFKSYKTGNKFGQLQIHQNIMSLIINAEDDSPIYSLKEKLAEVAPLSTSDVDASDSASKLASSKTAGLE